MSSWTSMITNRGRALQAKAQAGTPLQYTRFRIGDGRLTSQTIPALTDLISPIKYSEVKRIRYSSEGGSQRSMIGTDISTAGLTTGFFFREFGIYAMDPDVGEILYWYGNAGDTADYITPEGAGSTIDKVFNVLIYVGTSSQISASVDQSIVYVTQQEFDTAVGALQEEIDNIDPTLPDASTTQKGITSLSNATDSNSETEAATPKAVKTVNDKLTDHTRDYIRQPGYATTAGTGAAYTAELSPQPTSLVDGLSITIIPHTTNTDADPTLKIGTLGALPIRRQSGGTFAAGTIKAGAPLSLVKVGSYFLARSAGATGTATAGQVRAGATFSNENDIDLVGTLPVRTTTSVSANGTLPAGIYDSAVTVAVPDPSIGTTDAVAADLRAGKKMRSGGSLITGTKTSYTPGSRPETPEAVPGAGADSVNYYMNVPPGVYDDNVYVRKYDANFRADNIRVGTNVHGITGTLVPGRRYFSGNVPVGGNTGFINIGFVPSIVKITPASTGTLQFQSKQGNGVIRSVEINGNGAYTPGTWKYTSDAGGTTLAMGSSGYVVVAGQSSLLFEAWE